MRKIAQEAKVIVEDIVYRVEKDEKGRKIIFSKHSGVYYLKSNSKYYISILSAIEKSRDDGQLIKIKADSNSLEIEELILLTK